MAILKRANILIIIIFVLALGTQAWADAWSDYSEAKKAGKSKDFDKAFALYQKVIDSGQLKGKDLAEIYYSRGNTWFDKGDLDKAIADFSKCVELDPKNGDAYYSRAFAWDYKGEPDKAIADFTKAVEINPKDAESYYSRGNTWFDKGDMVRAIQDFTKAVEVQPNFSDAYYNRSIAYSNRGDLDKAFTDAKKALSLEPKNTTFKALVDELDQKIKDLL